MQTRTIANELYEHLKNENYYDETADRDDETLNQHINNSWKDRFERAISADIKELLKSSYIQVYQNRSIFELINKDHHGATTFKSFIDLVDNAEKMNIVTNLIVNHNNAFVYLGTSHTNEAKYRGTSKPLARLFKVLRKKEEIGNFHHSKFYELDI